MYRQVGPCSRRQRHRGAGADSEASAYLTARSHLSLPERLSGSREVLKWLAEELSPEVTISLMSQYHPMHRAFEMPSISRGITQEEYDEVFDMLNELGMENGWVQQMEAQELYLPDFERPGHPFNK
jgi:putative pyruvate formate lyase activating enzyme